MRRLPIIACAALVSLPASAVDQTSWGQPVNGWRIGVESGTTSVTADQELTFTVRAQNVSSAPITIPTPDKLGWTEADLARQAKGDVRKVHIARRLRSETAVTLKWIAQNLHMGVWTYVSNQLQNSNLTRATQKKLRLYQ